MTRRGRGEGTIAKLGDGTWRAGISQPGGRRQWFRAKTRAEALAKLKAAVAARDRGEMAHDGRGPTLAAFLREWLDAKRHRLEPSTWTRYEELARLYAIPALGAKRLEKLTPADLQKLYSSVIASGRSPTTAKQLHAVMHGALKQAERWGLVTRNVASLVDKPKAVRQEQATWSLADARRFFAAIQDDPLEALYVVAITTGMRQGEILRLRWEYVDLERGSLSIPKAKNPTSRRFVALSGIAVAALWKLHDTIGPLHSRSGLRIDGVTETAQGGDCASPDVTVKPTGSLFPLTADQLRHRYWKLLAGASLPRIRFHDLRHTIATLLLQEGVPAKMVGEMLGHSSIVVTMDVYSHVTPGMHAEVASVIDGLFSPKMLPTP